MFAVNAWNKMKNKTRRNHWYHKVKLSDVIVVDDNNAELDCSNKFLCSLVELSQLKTEPDKDEVEIFIATKMKGKTSMRSALKFMTDIFKSDKDIIAEFCDYNNTFYLGLQIKQKELLHIAGVLFTRFEQDELNTIMIDYLVINDGTPKIDFSLYDNFRWQG